MFGTLKQLVFNPYVVGGSLALIGASFYVPGWTTVLDRTIWGNVTVKQVVGLIPLSLGLGVLFGQVRGWGLPVVSEVAGFGEAVVAPVATPSEAAI